MKGGIVVETWDALQKDVEMYLAKRPGKTAVSCWLLTEKQGFSIGGKNELPSASLIKLLVLVELCEEVRRGRANLKEAISILGPAITGGDGIIKELKIGHTFTLEELATLMIIVSDNEAANQLIDRLGMKAINERAKKLGLAQTHLGRLMMADASGEKERDNWTSADDTVHLLRVICETAKTGSPLGRWMISLLARQQQEGGLRRNLSDFVQVAHKCGNLAGVEHDAGIFFGKRPYLLAVLTTEQPASYVGRETIGMVSLLCARAFGLLG